MTTHYLKTWTKYFNLVATGNKKFELRKNDRNFQVGDELILQEYNPDTKEYLGRNIYKYISYILEDAESFGLKGGYVIMQLS